MDIEEVDLNLNVNIDCEDCCDNNSCICPFFSKRNCECNNINNVATTESKEESPKNEYKRNDRIIESQR